MRTLLDTAPPTGRVGRYPKHNFYIKEQLWTACPMMIAPVLPGETMESLFFEARVITDPILNPIIGWKKQFYFFYVRITDLLNNTIRDMFIDPTNTDLGATMGRATDTRIFYTAKGGMDYALLAMQQIVNTYFRDTDTTYGMWINSDGSHRIQHRENLFMDSLTDKDNMAEGAALASASDAGDLERLMDAFNQLRSLGVANMTYEEFLRSYGLSIPKKDENKPELLGSFSDFQYPTNTVEPTTGVPASAVSWVFKNSIRKPKLFKEPGFIIGVSCTRPKIYHGGLAGNAAAHMSRAWDWMPNYLDGAPATSLKQFASGTGPLGDRTTDEDSYWLDMRDLLLYGDQWQNANSFNVVPAVVGKDHLMPIPANGLSGLNPTDSDNWKYISEADAKQLFKTPASAFYVKSDGYVSLSIKGKQIDYTMQSTADY